MKCPTCVSESKQSVVRIASAGTSTDMVDRAFYDQAGVYHLHSHNRTCLAWQCSEGHSGQIFTSTRCQANGCNFGELASICVNELPPVTTETTR